MPTLAQERTQLLAELSTVEAKLADVTETILSSIKNGVSSYLLKHQPFDLECKVHSVEFSLPNCVEVKLTYMNDGYECFPVGMLHAHDGFNAHLENLSQVLGVSVISLPHEYFIEYKIDDNLRYKYRG